MLDILPFEEIAGTDCQIFNILPLMPALPKYMPSSEVCLETLIFKTAKLKNQKLILVDPKKEPNSEEIWEKSIGVFKELMENEEFI